MSQIFQLNVSQLSQGLQQKQFSAQEVAAQFLTRIKESDLGAFVAVDEEVTMAQAAQADKLLAGGQAGPLTGVPVAHKDIFVTKNFVTTACSQMLRDYRSPFDATVVAKLSAQGAVTLGKLSCDEFAMGATNENSCFGAVLNPWDKARVPGGSSGGSAAAVAARLAPAATGTDTGGSIRQPASFCGVTGIKPTYGRVSRYGMIAFASSLDQAGPLAQTAQDCALLLQAIAGADLEHDSTSMAKEVPDYSRDLTKSLKGLRIGVPREFMQNEVTAEVAQMVEQALAVYRDLGAQLVDISLPLTKLSIPVYYVLAPAEASSNLSRYDGVKFGYRAADYADLNDMYVKTRSEGFGEEVKRRIMIGTYVLSHGYYDAYYLQAQKIRRLIAQDFRRAFADCDVIAGPVAPTVAPPLKQAAKDPIANYLADIFTLPASLAGLPAMSVPSGFTAGGLPVGLQLIGDYFQEARLLNVAHQFQGVTNFHCQAPRGV